MTKPLANLLLFALDLFAVFSLSLGDASSYPSWKLGTVIGIDLGTTYSCVGMYKNDDIDITANDQGNRITPSWVACSDTDRLIGEAAMNQGALNADRTVFNVKRLIGRKFEDPEVQRDVKMMPNQIVNKDGKPYVQMKLNGKTNVFSPQEITAMTLKKLKEAAEGFLGEKIKDAVITVPAYFNDAQREATMEAGTKAGLNVIRIMGEPIAAVVASGLDWKVKEKNILVYDLGGGTFDVTIVCIDDGMFEVRSTSGDTHLGGEDFDHRIVDYFIKLIKNKYGKDISENNEALGKLRRACEKAKRALSSQHQVRVEIESLFDGVNFSEPLTRAKFEELNMDLFKKTLGPVKAALAEARLKKSDIDEILLFGGSTRIPKIQELLKDFFNGKEPYKGVNPDEAVAHGAAVYDGILSTDERYQSIYETFLVFVTPLSLGIETAGGVMTRLINKYANIPTKKSQVFTTYQDQQTSVSIRIFEGERSLTKDCIELGKFNFSGIAPAPRGVAKIQVTLEVDVNDIITVKAEDKATKKSESFTVISDKRRLTQEETERMIEEAEEFAEEDKKMREKIGARNELESPINEDKENKTDGDDKEKLGSSMKEALEDNQNADNPIIRQVHEKSGGASSGYSQ
ncbi:luminal-binding protein 5-like [Mangifera indica]|uniref:luminal-binding protein 5-like n=1 Tax=Mangifera indica TaxID=29780 RepID=UPI001CFA0CA8|nr:luminal-binding protein 5-like [Mangifera indica]